MAFMVGTPEQLRAEYADVLVRIMSHWNAVESAVKQHSGLVLTTLGGVTVSCRKPGRGRGKVGPGKPAALIAYLTCLPGRSARRDRLVDLLWSDRTAESGQHDLRQTVWYIRQHLGEVVTARHGNVGLVADVVSDRDTFVCATENGDLEGAVELYRGHFFPGVTWSGASGFEEWADLERYRLRRLFSRAAESLVRQWLPTGRHADAQRLARRVRDADPHAEGAWVLLLDTLLAAGESVRAAAEADLFERVFTTDGRVPEPSTRVLLLRVRRAAKHGASSETPLVLAPAMVGRDRELAALLQAWGSARGGSGRHVHLAGDGGLGKTRILMEFRDRLQLAGYRVLYFAARYAGRRVMFAHAAELAAQLARLPGSVAVSPAAAAALVALNPMLSTHYVAQADTSPAEDALRGRAFALLELVTAVSEETPLALLCDDMGWADRASTDALAWVLGNVGSVSVLCVTAGTAAFASPATERLEATALSVNMVHALASSIARLPAIDWAERLPSTLHEVTGGSPRLVLEQLQVAVEHGRLCVGDGWACPDPAALAAQLAEPSHVVSTPLLVSPFIAEGGGDSEYLAAGMTEGLISDLSRIEGLRVVALASALRLSGIADLRARAAAVGARYVLEGRVKIEGDRVNVAAQLRDAERGVLLREELCSGSRSDWFELREQIVRAVGEGLHVPLRAAEALKGRGRPTDMQVYECYLRARQHLMRYEPEEIERGLRILHYGIESTTHSGMLHAALGMVDFTLVFSGVDPTESRLQSAEQYAAKAFAIEPDAIHTHVLAGVVAWARGRPQEAVRELRRTLELEPNHPDALCQLGNIYAAAGKTYAASALLSRVFEVDPLTPANHSLTGLLMTLEGRFDEAAEGPYRLMVALDPCPPALIITAMGLARVGNTTGACAMLDAVPQSGAGAVMGELGAFMRHALAGDSAEALRALTPRLETYARFVYYHPWHLAAGLALIGDLDRAFVWLRHAMVLGFVHYPFLLIDPLLANMRDDARWPELAEDVRRLWDEFEV